MPDIAQIDSPHIGPIAREQYQRTFHIAAWGEQIHPDHPDGGYPIDERFFEDLLEAHADMARDGFYPPVLRDHDKAEGYTYGIVTALRKTKAGIEADVVFAKGYEQRFDDGLLDSWSPTWVFGFTHPVTGKAYPAFMSELSFVSKRQFKNLAGASPHYKNAEHVLAPSKEAAVADDKTKKNEEPQDGVQNEEEGEEQEVESAEEGSITLESLAADVGEMKEGIALILEHLSTMTPVTPADPVENTAIANAEVTRLTKQAEALRLQNAELTLRTELGALPADQQKHLTGLMLSNAEAGRATIALLKAARLTAPATRVMNAEAGSPAPGPVAGLTLSNVELAKKAKAQDIKQGRDLMRFMREQGADPATITNAEQAAIDKVYRAR